MLKMKTMTAILVILGWLVCSTADLSALGGWSDEVRMTYLGEDEERTRIPKIARDTEDNLHFAWKQWHEDYDSDGLNVFYQKFSRTGEAQTEPVNLTHQAGLRDTTQCSYFPIDVCISDNQNVFILVTKNDHNFRPDRQTYHVVFFPTTDIDEIQWIDLEELPSTGNLELTHFYHIFTDSEENIIIAGSTSGDDDYEGFDGYGIVFSQKYDLAGNQIGETFFVNDDDYNGDHARAHLTADDELCICWRSREDGRNIIRFSKFDRDNEPVIDKMVIPGVRHERDATGVQMRCDQDENLLFSLWDTDGVSLWVRKYTPDMEELYERYIGESNRYYSAATGPDNTLHLGLAFEDREDQVCPYRYYHGYTCINEDGALPDSADVVSCSRPYSSAYEIFVCDDGFVGILWLDNRFGAQKCEVYLKYNHPNSVAKRSHNPVGDFKLYEAYPNPFNSSTSISFYLPHSMNIELGVYDHQGHKLQVLTSGIEPAGMHSLQWNANGLPAGSYLLRMRDEGGAMRDVKKVVLVK